MVGAANRSPDLALAPQRLTPPQARRHHGCFRPGKIEQGGDLQAIVRRDVRRDKAPQAGHAENDSLTGPPRSTMPLNVLDSDCVMVAPSMKGREADNPLVQSAGCRKSRSPRIAGVPDAAPRLSRRTARIPEEWLPVRPTAAAAARARFQGGA